MVVCIRFLTLAFTGLYFTLSAIAQSHFVVTGVHTGGIQPRLEVRVLQTSNPPMWNLYLQALEKFMDQDQDDKLSYYTIAGIHGQPFVTWDKTPMTGKRVGFCPHFSNLFIPWHRLYLALFEQRLAMLARQIAQQFPKGSSRDTYVTAARNFRVPYWDWAQKSSQVIPQSLIQRTISVHRPSGKTEMIPNPLSHYHFHPLDSSALGGSPYHETVRAPGDSLPAVSDNSKVERDLKGQISNLRQTIYTLLAQGGQYNQISNVGASSAITNFERPHNSVHYAFKPKSHMYDPTLAAFDPIFWLHHANVDRQLALWQTLWPKTYVEPTRQQSATWTIDRSSTQGANAPLGPFHRDQVGNFWTPHGARGWKTFGYTYPELADNPSAATLRSRVTQLYGSALGVSGDVVRRPWLARRAIATSLLTVPGADVSLDIAPGDVVYQYSAAIRMPRTMAGQPYSVLVFLGQPGDDPAEWMEDPHLVGYQGMLRNPSLADPDQMIEANIFLTDALVEKYAAGHLPSLDEDAVLSYLSSNLQWGIEQNGQAIAPDSVPGIEVRVASQAVKAPQSEDEFPSFMEVENISTVNSTVGAV